MTYSDSFRSSDSFTRTFLFNVSDDDLIWHRDAQDRIIKVIQSMNWQLIMQNCFPINLETDQYYFIQKNTYHRLKKGTGNLILEITNK